MSGLGVHPRLAHMILRGARLGHLTLAVRIAALLSERDILRGVAHERDPDLRVRLDALSDTGPRTAAFDAQAVQRVRQAAAQITKRVRGVPLPDHASPPALTDDEATGLLLAFAYPDRIGRLRDGRVGQYLLSGGRGAQLRDSAALARSEFIVAATLDAGAADARIQLAAPLRREIIDEHLASAIEDVEFVSWDTRSAAVLAQRERRLGALRLEVATRAHHCRRSGVHGNATNPSSRMPRIISRATASAGGVRSVATSRRSAPSRRSRCASTAAERVSHETISTSSMAEAKYSSMIWRRNGAAS